MQCSTVTCSSLKRVILNNSKTKYLAILFSNLSLLRKYLHTIAQIRTSQLHPIQIRLTRQLLAQRQSKMETFSFSQMVRKEVPTRKRNWKVKVRRTNHIVKSLLSISKSNQKRELHLLRVETIESKEEKCIEEGSPREAH
jgi:predicted HTH domain antitoxin